MSVNRKPDMTEECSKPTSARGHVIWDDNVVTLFVIARRVVIGRLRRRKMRVSEKLLNDGVGAGWLRTPF